MRGSTCMAVRGSTWCYVALHSSTGQYTRVSQVPAPAGVAQVGGQAQLHAVLQGPPAAAAAIPVELLYAALALQSVGSHIVLHSLQHL